MIEAQAYDRSIEVLPSVLLALRLGRRNNSSGRQISVKASEYYTPDSEALRTGMLTRHYRLDCVKKRYNSMFPKNPKTHDRRYTIEITDFDCDVVTFFGIEIEHKEIRDNIEYIIDEKHKKGLLNEVFGSVSHNSLYLAPFRTDGSVSYHRALGMVTIGKKIENFE